MEQLYYFTPSEIEELREYFESYEIDNMGWVNKNYLQGLIVNIKYMSGNYNFDENIEKADSEGNGTIEFPEFLAIISQFYKPIQIMKEIDETFDMLDSDGDEYVLIPLLKNIMRKLFPHVTEEEIFELFRFDMDGSDLLSKSDFLYIISIILR